MHVSNCNGVNYTNADKPLPVIQVVRELEHKTSCVAAGVIEAQSEAKRESFAGLMIDVLALVFSHLPKENVVHSLVSRYWYRAAVALNDVYKNRVKTQFPLSCVLLEQSMATLPKGITFWRNVFRREYAYSLKFCRTLDVQSERKEILHEELGFTQFFQEFLNDSLTVVNLDMGLDQSASFPGSTTEPFVYFNSGKLNVDKFSYFESEQIPVFLRFHEELTHDKIRTVATAIFAAVVDKNPHALRKVLSENRVLARKLLDFFFGVFLHCADEHTQRYRCGMGSFFKDAHSGDARDVANILWELISEKINHTYDGTAEKIERAVITNQPEHVLKTLGSWATIAPIASDLAVNIGNLALVKLLEDRAPNFIQTLQDDCPALAIANGISDTIIYLIGKYPHKYDIGHDVLVEACISGNIQVLTFLLDRKVGDDFADDVDILENGFFSWFCHNESGFYPKPFPHVDGEIAFRHTETAKFLIERGLVDPKGADEFGVPFLYYALRSANLKSVQLLLNLGANFSTFSLVHYEELVRGYCEDESPYRTKKAAVYFLLDKIQSFCSLEEMIFITLGLFVTIKYNKNRILTETLFSMSNLCCERIIKRVYWTAGSSDLLKEPLKELYEAKFASYSSRSIPSLTIEPDLLLLLALITQQPIAEIAKLLDSGASIFGLGANMPSPSSFAEKFHPEADEFILGLINGIEAQMIPEYLPPVGYFPISEDTEEIPEIDMFTVSSNKKVLSERGKQA